MKTSLILRTRDQWSRLRLVLASIEGQDELDEVVVVDDGSVDCTWERLTDTPFPVPLVTLRNPTSIGQSATWNAGAAAASGDLLIFLDGDVLAGPGLVAAHRRAHAAAGDLVGRGETWHLRCTRFLSDPETGEFWAHERERALQTGEKERDRMRIPIAQVRDDFAAVHARAAPGCYPGIGPKRLHETEMRMLYADPPSPRLWAAASGSNSSVRRERFHAVGGFEPEMDINEHRELAYRLCGQGARMAPVPGARSYHLTHRVGWRDPLEDAAWERAFRRRHPEAPIDELKQFWLRVGTEAADVTFFR